MSQPTVDTTCPESKASPPEAAAAMARAELQQPTQEVKAPPQAAPETAPEAELQAARQLSRSGGVLRLQARALEHERFDAAATAVVTEMAKLLECDRVSVGFFHHQGRVRVAAMSHGGDIQQQQNLVRCLAAAMHEALDQHNLIVHPMPRDSAPGLSLAHAELAHLNGHLPICTVPIISQGRLFGAFLLERRAGIDLHTLDAAKDAASFIGPLLELKHRLNQPLSGRMADAVAPPGRRIGPLALRTPVLAAAAVALLLLVLAFWPTTLRVVAPARVEGAGQRVVAAPVDGFVQSVAVRPGETVKAGQTLLTLEDRDLALERDKWAAEASQLERQYREALNQDEAATIVVARSKLEQAQAQLKLLQRQMQRASITAPMDGVVLTGDLTQAVGSPVKRGQELMTVAPDQRFRIVAEVDEQDITRLQLGQPAQVMFGALVGHNIALTVKRIAPVATATEQGNAFEVEALPIDAASPGGALRPGLRGVMRIDIEPSTLGAVWWQRASHWAQRTSWRWLG